MFQKFIESDCVYHGRDRGLLYIEDRIPDAKACQQICLKDPKCASFSFHLTTNECSIINTDRKTCFVLFGPQFPPLNKCPIHLLIPRNKINKAKFGKQNLIRRLANNKKVMV